MPVISTFPIVNGGGGGNANTDLGYTELVDVVEGEVPELSPMVQVAIDGVQTSITNLEAEVEATKKSVSDGKILVANAITGKGIATATDATFATMASNISSIDTLTTGTADATATAAQILSGQTAYVKGSKVTGTMTDQGAKTSSLNAGGSYTIPAGYHNGSGKITANSLASQTSATATAAQILSGQTAWVNGSKITGTLVQGKKSANGTTSLVAGGKNTWTHPSYGHTITYYSNLNTTLTVGFKPSIVMFKVTACAYTTGTVGEFGPNNSSEITNHVGLSLNTWIQGTSNVLVSSSGTNAGGLKFNISYTSTGATLTATCAASGYYFWAGIASTNSSYSYACTYKIDWYAIE